MSRGLFAFVRWARSAAALSVLTGLPTIAHAAPSDLFISEVIEGSSNNKAVEIYNGTASAVTLTGSYQLKMYFNGNSSAGVTLNLNGSIASGDVFVVASSSADAAILAQADQTSGASFFNGDDALELVKAGSVIDSFGQVGVDPGTEWFGGGLDDTLRRKSEICSGDVTSNDAFETSVEWESFAVNSFGDLGSHVANCSSFDLAPQLLGTMPLDGAVDVDLGASLTLRFNEPVAVEPASAVLSCDQSGLHVLTIVPSGNEVLLDPEPGFASGEQCQLLVSASGVVDLDGEPNPLESDVLVSFTARLVSVCGGPATPIHAVQGAGSVSPFAGATVTIEGVVVGDFQGGAGLNGFFVQEEVEDSDADPLTSEGVFVFDAAYGTNVNLGDVVRVKGVVSEYFELTEVSQLSELQSCATGTTLPAAEVAFPHSGASALEAVEGMLVSVPQTLFVSENFNQGRYGEVLLSAGDRLRQPTQVAAPGAAALAVQQSNALSAIQLDDGSNIQNPATAPYLGTDQTLRIGDTVSGLSGVLSYSFGAFELHPTEPVSIVRSNPREQAPAPRQGSLRVASMNVLNYFTTLDTGASICGPDATLDCRGANNMTELGRQRAKIVAALSGLSADVVGLLEVENNAEAATADLVAGLNAALGDGAYEYVDTGTIGSDAIKVALIYDASRVQPLGQYAILDTSVDPRFIDTRNRPVLAQSFEQLSNGEVFTIAVNHLKSKGSSCADLGDPDLLDGQGNCNATRTAAIEAELDWLATDPTLSGDPDLLLMGDFNAYALEDPIVAVTEVGYTNLLADFVGPHAYSYVFEGQSGALDQAIASANLRPQVRAVSEWHINADEPHMLDYNLEFNPPGLYAPDAFRASDHDPLVIDLELSTALPVPTCNGATATVYIDAAGRIVGGPDAGQPFNGLLRGTTNNDVMVGTSRPDLIAGLGGSDIVCGLDGSDILIGSNGADQLFGGPGVDLLQGAAGNDLLDGGADSDILEGAGGADTLYGADGIDVIDGGAGADQLFGGAASDVLRGGAGVDRCDGGAGADIAFTCETLIGVP